VPATVRDPTKFLDIDMDQVPGLLVFVAAYNPSGAPIKPGQFRQPVSGQDAVHRGGVDA
jgi:hypothetical protein